MILQLTIIVSAIASKFTSKEGKKCCKRNIHSSWNSFTTPSSGCLRIYFELIGPNTSARTIILLIAVVPSAAAGQHRPRAHRRRSHQRPVRAPPLLRVCGERRALQACEMCLLRVACAASGVCGKRHARCVLRAASCEWCAASDMFTSHNVRGYWCA